MNKVLITAVLAGGLMLLAAPDAEAHKRGHDHPRHWDYGYSRSYDRDYYYRYRGESRYRRSHEMPRWLKRDRSFRHWYRHSRLRKNRHISWHRLYDIYCREYPYYRYRRY